MSMGPMLSIYVKEPAQLNRMENGKKRRHQVLVTAFQGYPSAASCCLAASRWLSGRSPEETRAEASSCMTACFRAQPTLLRSCGGVRGLRSKKWLYFSRGNVLECHGHQNGVGGQGRHLPYQWRFWYQPLLYIVSFEWPCYDPNLNESTFAFLGTYRHSFS